jgi:integrase/recombinase XerD
MTGDLHQAIDSYIALRRGLGYQLLNAERALHDYADFLLARGETTVTTASVVVWATSREGTTAHYAVERLSHVRTFARYLAAFEPDTEVPPINMLGGRRRRTAPHIYSETEVGSLMAFAATVHPEDRGAALEVLIGLLAATGLRPGEAYALDRGDVDLTEGILTIHESKFHKSREVPLHESTVTALRAYRSRRDRWFSKSPTSPFIACRPQGRLAAKNVHYAFQRLLTQAGVDDPERRWPRLHDFRHTFAVKTLLDWHARGLDVQSMLPLLSTYLGHVNPNTTYWYLSAEPELLRAAADRLEEAQR